ncbi:MAG: winged helix-turn-helix domain-containing protein, partial [Clostridia bacterium]|nr:winged helix-turn-helix domain-containing protein [Clostridia bacterium]
SELLMSKIWGYDTETEIYVVWVYLSYLRKKLATIGANVRIKANRNLGYLLEEIK